MSIPDRVLLHHSNGAAYFFYEWEVLLARLSYFAHKGPDICTLELEDGRYIQLAGVKRRLTVESRTYENGGQFTHIVWGKGARVGSAETIQSQAGTVTVDASQVLIMRDARILIQAFLENEPMPARYCGFDVSSRFAPIPEGMKIRHRLWELPDSRLRRRPRWGGESGAGNNA